jgi:hypothetical protein
VSLEYGAEEPLLQADAGLGGLGTVYESRVRRLLVIFFFLN